MLQSMGSQRFGHDLAIEQQQQKKVFDCQGLRKRGGVRQSTGGYKLWALLYNQVTIVAHQL